MVCYGMLLTKTVDQHPPLQSTNNGLYFIRHQAI